jgi:glycosyltransferase involved in cell wall biosynthesis
MSLNLGEALVHLGMSVELVVARAEGELLTQVPTGVRMFDLRTSGMATSIRPLIQYLRSRRPAGLIARMQHVNTVAALAHWLAKSNARLLLTEATHATGLLRELSLTAQIKYRCGLWPTMRRVYRRADAVVAVSHGVAADLAVRLGLPRELLHVVPNPVLTDRLARLARDEPSHPWLRAGSRRDSHPNGSVLLAVGSLREAKDFVTLLRGFAILRKRFAVRLIIYGEGPERSRLARLRCSLGLDDCVDLPGFAENPYSAMARASLFVLSSRREGSPNVLVESLACGCPVVATDCESGPAEILDAGRYGLLSPVGDPGALAAAMQEGLKRTWDIQHLQQRARRYDSRQTAQRYLELLGISPPAAAKSAAA